MVFFGVMVLEKMYAEGGLTDNFHFEGFSCST